MVNKLYARSKSVKEPEVYRSNIGGSQCKISNLLVLYNELCAKNLVLKMAIAVLDAMPEFPKILCVSFITDSQCDAFTQNPLFVVINSKYLVTTLLFIRTPGIKNSDNLNSKCTIICLNCTTAGSGETSVHEILV